MSLTPIRKRVKWRDVQNIVDNLSERIKKSGIDYSCIISINRGGLIIGTCLSYKLNIPHGVISVSRKYGLKDGVNQFVDTDLPPEQQLNIDKNISINDDVEKMKNILLFDDSCDTGYLMTHTVNFIKSKLPNLKQVDTAVIFLQKQSDYLPTYYYEKMDGSQLFVFDWEQF